MTDDTTTPDLFSTDTGEPEAVEKQFEQVLDRLEEIVHDMEGGGLSLAESLKLYEEGAAHIKTLNGMLADVRETVLKLVDTPNGEPILENFDQEEAS